MDILFIKVFYYVSFAGYLLAFILTLKPSWIHIFKKVFTVSLVLNGAVFVLFWYRSGHFPFSEGFAESYVAMGFVLAMMSLLLSDSTSSPLFYDGTQVSLFRFSDLSPGAKADEKKRGCNVCGGSKGQGPKKLTLEDVRPGVLLIISRNPIGPAFFWFYALFILSIGGYLAVIWSGKGEK